MPVLRQVGGGGNSVGWVFLRVDDLNESLVDAEFNQLPGGMLTWGGGYGTVGVGNGKWSIGGWYGGGEAISKPTAGAEPKIATLALNYGGGILVEYSAVDSPKAHVGLGTVLGGGGMASLTTKRGMISDFDEALGAASSASVWRPYLLAQPPGIHSFPAVGANRYYDHWRILSLVQPDRMDGWDDLQGFIRWPYEERGTALCAAILQLRAAASGNIAAKPAISK